MRIETRDDFVVVLTLSERNLRAGLAKVNDPTSAKTIYAGDFIVQFEPDDVHYSHPSRNGQGPGLIDWRDGKEPR